MSLARQVSLLPAGCQPWNIEVVASSRDRFAYCATLAVYVYQYDHQYSEFKLMSIMSEHKKTITALAWNPRNPDQFVSCSTDNVVIVWDVVQQKVVARLDSTQVAPCSVGWTVHDKESVSFVYGRGPFYLWNILAAHSGLSVHKEAVNFMSDVCQFRWHPKKMGKLVFGHMDGSLSIFCPGQRSQKHVLRSESLEGSDEDDPVTALEWDPLSTEYLLVASSHHGVRLLDSDALATIMSFQLPSAAAQVHTLDWVHTAPGMFVTGDTHTGVLRIWSVSKSSPIESIRLKKTGFHVLTVFSTSPGTTRDGDSLTTAPPSPAPSHSAARYALPSAHALCTFLDGGVGLYDLGTRRWNFLRDFGHVETIFDCRFKPDNPDLLATGSFDGTIKVWDVGTLKAVYTSPGNEGVIYSLSWAPSDINCLAASTSKNGAFIWDLDKGKIIKRFTEHGKSAVYCVAWNHKDSRRIATAGGDSFCVVRQVDGQTLMRYKHPGPVYGCDWNIHNKDMLVTGCEDGNVRVFYLATTNEQPLKVFSGHTAKVFQVRWSPLREGILCSGSDDCTIRVWDYTADCCRVTLQGHNGPVRGLLWSWEIPYLLISGSWDYTIRVWDTRDGACLDRILDHGADVYGLTSHPSRPFVLASCSRDSTVRVWLLNALVQPLEINFLANQPWNTIFANQEQCYDAGAAPLLLGRASRELRTRLDALSGPQKHAATLQHISKFFSSPVGVDNLWDLVSVVKGRPESMLRPEYKKGILHHRHITKYKAAEAQELELSKVSKFGGGGGIGAPSKEEKTREAAAIHIRVGNVQRYCELMVELGEWEKALAVAPGVSVEYWRSLAERRARQLMSEDSTACVPYCVAVGDTSRLVRFFSSRGQLQDAVLTAAASHEGSIAAVTNGNHARGHQVVNGVTADLPQDSLVKKTSEELADWYMRHGSAVLAACCHLSVDDCQRAMSKLLRGNELELVVSVGRVLGNVPYHVNTATEYLARRAERLEKWDLAIELLKTIPDSADLCSQVCCRCSGSADEINALHAKADVPDMARCLELAETHKHNGEERDAIKHYLLSGSPETGLEYGLGVVKEFISQTSWTADQVFPILQLLGSVRTERLQKFNKYVPSLMLYSCYVGALMAARRRYNCIVASLLGHAIELVQKCDVPLSLSMLQSELDAWQATEGQSSPKTLPKELQLISTEFFRKAGSSQSDLEPGEDKVSGSHLPSHSDVHTSVITGQRIQGPAFFLEDGRSVMSISEAMMWAKVNPFSPLQSGVRINPF